MSPSGTVRIGISGWTYGGTRRTTRRAPIRPCLDADRMPAGAAPRDRDPSSELSRPRLRGAVAPPPDSVRFRRLGGVALRRGLDRRLRLSAPARLRGAL